LLTGRKTGIIKENGIWYAEQSKDGGKIAFVKSDKDKKTSLWTINSDGSNKKQITDPSNTTSINGNMFSDDGVYILFYHYGQINQNVLLAKSDGSQSQYLEDVLDMKDIRVATWYPRCLSI
jgi:Tol biopolymer transport system component